MANRNSLLQGIFLRRQGIFHASHEFIGWSRELPILTRLAAATADPA
jgi:hypothetical protein